MENIGQPSQYIFRLGVVTYELHPANLDGVTCSWYGAASVDLHYYSSRILHCDNTNKTVASVGASPAKVVVASVAIPKSVYLRIAGNRREMVRD